VSRIRRGWFLVLVLTLILLSILAHSFLSQPQTVDLAAPIAKDVQSVVTRMYELQGNLVCQANSDVSVLDEVLLDTSDYHPSLQELNTIQKVFGIEVLIHAGYLTSQKAYWMTRLNPTLSTPEPGIKPTAPPTNYCPTPPAQIQILFTMVALEKNDRAVVQYDYGGGVFEAILRMVDSRWMITSIKLIKWHGI